MCTGLDLFIESSACFTTKSGLADYCPAAGLHAGSTSGTAGSPSSPRRMGTINRARLFVTLSCLNQGRADDSTVAWVCLDLSGPVLVTGSASASASLPDSVSTYLAVYWALGKGARLCRLQHRAFLASIQTRNLDASVPSLDATTASFGAHRECGPHRHLAIHRAIHRVARLTAVQ